MGLLSLDILIPIYNEDEYLDELFYVLTNLVVPKTMKLRIVISDNCSTDRSIEKLKTFKFSCDFELYFQTQNTGGHQNWTFLLSKIESEYFMIMDAHDSISLNYLQEFEKSQLSCEASKAFIGKILRKNNLSNGNFIIHSDPNLTYSENHKFRFWQLVFNLGHNTLVHSIFKNSPRRVEILKKSKSLTLDHLITHSGLLDSNILFGKDSTYTRLYRVILGTDFEHMSSNGLTETRTQRVSGINNKVYDNVNLPNEILSLPDLNFNKIGKFCAYIILKSKYSQQLFHIFFFKLLRFIFNSVSSIAKIRLKFY